MPATLPKLILFITGAFFGPNCWDEWQVYFGSKGYTTIAPPLPYKDFTAEELRNRNPDADIASSRLAELTEFFAAIIADLPERPILIGHSLGGLVVQLLLHRGLGAAGVAIHSFPSFGPGTYNLAFIKQWWQALGVFTGARTSYLIPFTIWCRSVANGLSCEQQKESYYAYAVPQSKHMIRDAFTSRAKIDPQTSHAPLLLTSGSQDVLIPSSVCYKTYKKYKTANFITHYKEFEGHNHLVFGETFWLEEAIFIFFWLREIDNN